MSMSRKYMKYCFKNTQNIPKKLDEYTEKQMLKIQDVISHKQHIFRSK